MDNTVWTDGNTTQQKVSHVLPEASYMVYVSSFSLPKFIGFAFSNKVNFKLRVKSH